ncbi:MAG: hypothetical protein ACW981_11390 [Candidatus Hodarchaeales archaeon]
MIDSTLTFFFLRIVHIIGFTLGFATSFALILLYLVIRKNKNLLDIFKIMRYLIFIQIITNAISSISGLFRLNFSDVLENPSQIDYFYSKMLVFSAGIIVIVILFFWFSKLISFLKTQEYRNNYLNKKQDLISIIFLSSNIVLLSLTFLLGGLLSIL